jgi:D-3-phosphoglycerate dehydrogenase
MREVICTPHLVAATFEAQINVARRMARQVNDFITSGQAENVVNADALSALRASGE